VPFRSDLRPARCSWYNCKRHKRILPENSEVKRKITNELLIRPDEGTKQSETNANPNKSKNAPSYTKPPAAQDQEKEQWATGWARERPTVPRTRSRRQVHQAQQLQEVHLALWSPAVRSRRQFNEET
jgi:hypothetical protein